MIPPSEADLLLLIVSSPSGAGKTTLTRRLLSQFPELTFSVSHTTRAPRSVEVAGKDYHFTDRAAFTGMVKSGAFAEWATVHGHLYGTSVAEIKRANSEGKSGVVFDIDYQGARQIKSVFPSAIGVFILPPSMNALRERLRRRASDSEQQIAQRFAKAQEEIEHYPFFDYLIVNDDLQLADAQLRGVVHAELCRRRRLARRAELLLAQA